MRLGAVVAFDFTLTRVSLSSPIERRTGRGVVVEERCYQCWPPGVRVRVTESPDYAAGELVAVPTIDVREVRS